MNTWIQLWAAKLITCNHLRQRRLDCFHRCLCFCKRPCLLISLLSRRLTLIVGARWVNVTTVHCTFSGRIVYVSWTCFPLKLSQRHRTKCLPLKFTWAGWQWWPELWISTVTVLLTVNGFYIIRPVRSSLNILEHILIVCMLLGPSF